MLRYGLSYALFAMGHLVSLLLNLPGGQHTYPVYNWLMTKSNEVQGDGHGPWRAPE